MGVSASQSRPSSYELYSDPGREWPFTVAPKNPAEHPESDVSLRLGGEEFQFEGEDGKKYAGTYARALLYSTSTGADGEPQPFWLGKDLNSGQDVPIIFRESFRHTFLGGRTGEGKSTAAENILFQIIINGHGATFVDPGGESIYELAERLPEHALDRVIIANPADQTSDEVIGFNYFDLYNDPDDPGYDAEVEAVVSDILPMLEIEYPRMKGVAENMLRALLRKDHERDYSYSPIDLYYALATEESRQQYASLVDEGELVFLQQYADKIATELSDEDLEPLLRRLKNWVENPIIRQLVCQRDSKLSIGDIIENQKVLLVDADINVEDGRKIIANAVSRKVWSAVMSRMSETKRMLMKHGSGEELSPDDVDEDASFTPHYLIMDEFHAIEDESMNMDKMLAMARKKKLGLVILTQQLNQLSSGSQKAIRNNCATFVSFNPGKDPSEKRTIAQGFDGKDADDLMVDRYHATTTITNSAGRVSKGFVARMIPPLPPLRSKFDVITQYIPRSLERYGSPRLTDEEVLSQGIFSGGGGDGGEAEDNRQTLAAKAVYDAAIHADSSDGFVSERVASDRIERYVEGVSDGTGASAILQSIPERLVERRIDEDSGAVSYRCTDDGMRDLDDGWLGQGVSASAGKSKHREGVADAYELLSRLGLEMAIPMQHGTEEVDLVGRLRETWTPPEDVSDRQRRKAFERFASDEPELAFLTDGDDVVVEVECGTSRRPGQTIVNLRKAWVLGQRCLFAARSDDAARIERYLGGETPYQPAEGEYYTLGKLSIRGRYPIYEGSRTKWWTDESTGEVVLSNRQGDEQARFPNVGSVFSDIERYPDTQDSAKTSEAPEGWATVNEPVVPSRVFDATDPSEWPGRDAWDVIELPSWRAVRENGTDVADALQVIRDGTAHPLRELSTTDTSDKSRDTSDDGGDEYRVAFDALRNRRDQDR